MADQLRQRVAQIVNGLERYNPENLEILEKYVTISATENFYDLEAYLAVLKLYQFRPMLFNQDITIIILLKAMTNLPHSDFTLCKCIVDLPKAAQYDETFLKITQLWEMLETCQFDSFWSNLKCISDKIAAINGFEDSIRKFICHVVDITYQVLKKSDLKNLLGNVTDSETNQWISTNKWRDMGDGYVYVANQENFIKNKNITEKIDFNAVADVMRLSAK